MLCEPVRSDTDKVRDMWKVFAVLFQPNDLPLPSQSHFLIAHKYVYRHILVLASLEIHIQQKSCTVKFSIRVSVNMEIWIRFRSEATLLASRGIITLKCIHRLWNVNLSNSVLFFSLFSSRRFTLNANDWLMVNNDCTKSVQNGQTNGNLNDKIQNRQNVI